MIVKAVFLALLIFFVPFQILHGGDTLVTLFSIDENAIIAYSNSDRASAGLHALSGNLLLRQAAQLKADDMVRLHYFDHTNPSGLKAPHWLSIAGYDFNAYGENLALGFSDPQKLYTAWMASDGHRANILHSSFTEIGVASARGVYEGRDVVFTVALFGAPATLSTESPTIVFTAAHDHTAEAGSTDLPKVFDENVSAAKGSHMQTASHTDEKPQVVPMNILSSTSSVIAPKEMMSKPNLQGTEPSILEEKSNDEKSDVSIPVETEIVLMERIEIKNHMSPSAAVLEKMAGAEKPSSYKVSKALQRLTEVPYNFFRYLVSFFRSLT